MRKDKEKAESLRRAGKSYREIEKELGVARSTLSSWFGKEEWSQGIGEFLAQNNRQKSSDRILKLNRVRGVTLGKIYQNARAIAENEFPTLKQSPLFIAAMAAYWGQGDKASKGLCRIINTDPQMIRIFSRFLEEICGVPKQKIRYWLLLNRDLDERACKEYWQNMAQLGPESFSKSIYSKEIRHTPKISYGVCTAVASSRYLKEKMVVWLRLLADEFSPIPADIV